MGGAAHPSGWESISPDGISLRWIGNYCLKPWAVTHVLGDPPEASSLFGRPESRGESWASQPWLLRVSSEASSIVITKRAKAGEQRLWFALKLLVTWQLDMAFSSLSENWTLPNNGNSSLWIVFHKSRTLDIFKVPSRLTECFFFLPNFYDLMCPVSRVRHTCPHNLPSLCKHTPSQEWNSLGHALWKFTWCLYFC